MEHQKPGVRIDYLLTEAMREEAEMAGKGSALVYQMKVELLDIRRPIWRRFLVTSDRTLYRFHLILQSVMGWENYHLYRFTIDGIRFGEPDEEYEPDIKHARRTKLRNVIDAENQKVFYILISCTK